MTWSIGAEPQGGLGHLRMKAEVRAPRLVANLYERPHHVYAHILVRAERVGKLWYRARAAQHSEGANSGNANRAVAV